ncbi:GDYXXLXY domain-containing protein [Sphingobacterium sp. 1.A.4]|uniref:GDYXXLXY domain-containing protein n=1 Tax=Sphingobacterium sp. 1.A.4 TaxID=2044603 RepID=UPI000C0BE1D7|nr:GDYXXLXY domain-containing protein [Sphingobacterium sp. 1.A.4]
MKNYKYILILLNLAALLIYFNLSVFKKEQILEEGQLVLLKLAPVDPRSLMQGDYMRLNYEISNKGWNMNIPKRGYCIVKLDKDGIGHWERFQPEVLPLEKGEYALNYTIGNFSNINIGAESFFFEEGQAERYEKAAYGGLRIDGKGNSLLVGLYDTDRKKL